MAQSSVPPYATAGSSPDDGELDFRSVGKAVWRRKKWILLPAAVAGLLALVIVNVMTPRYKSEARIIVDGRENSFTRPDVEKNDRERATLDQEAVSSQVQLALSREVARQVIQELKLGEKPEFDATLKGIGPLRHILILLGLARDPLAMSAEERVFEAYYERIQAFQVEKSRVIAVEFQSSDPDLAARAANAVADAYLSALQANRREQTRAAGEWLLGEIEKLRQKVAEAEAKVEEFRSRSNLFMGSNNNSLSNQQLAEITTQLATARAQKSDADARAQAIRDMLKSGRPIESGDVINSELIRRLNEQRVTLRAQLAEQLSTLLDGHPRIKELRAQINDLERQIRGEAERLVRSLENDARIAAARVDQLSASLEQLKKQATSTNGQDVQLRAMEREAKSQRELLESYLAKYRETTARDSMSALPSDVRVISRAIVSGTPYFPKKLPIVMIATLGTLLLAIGLITTGELLASNAYGREVEAVSHPAAYPASYPVSHPATDAPPLAESAASPSLPRSSIFGSWFSERAESAPPVADEITMPKSSELAEIPTVPEMPDFNVAGYSMSSMIDRFRSGPSRRSRVAVVSLHDAAEASETAAALARALAGQGRSIWIDAAFARAGATSRSRGIADLVRGTATFGEIIARDAVSRAHFVAAGRSDAGDIGMLASDRLSIALDALERSYEHLTIDAGSLRDVPAMYAARLAPTVVLVVPETAERESDLAIEKLRAAGCADVMIVVAPQQAPTANRHPAAAA